MSSFLPQEPSSTSVVEIEPDRVRNLWNSHMKNIPKASRYLKTVALLLSWEETDLRTSDEVAELHNVLKDTYNFTVERESIKKEKRAQHQVQKHLATFVNEHDGPSTLLIIYYAGHGWKPRDEDPDSNANGDPDDDSREDKDDKNRFYLMGKTDLQAQQDLQRNSVAWHSAESLLEGTDADVLAIFDCCQAGQLCRFRAPIRFEYLAACGADQRTPVPGKNSFTQALIWALNKLSSKEHFPTSELLRTIERAPHFRDGVGRHQPVLAHRIYPSPDHIHLGPMKKPGAEDAISTQAELAEPQNSHRESLDLRFHFPVELRDAVIKQTAEALSALIAEKKIQSDCVSFLCKGSNHLQGQDNDPKLLQVAAQIVNQLTANRYARRWRETTNKHRSPANSVSPGDEHQANAQAEESATNSRRSKRRRHG